MYFDNWLPLNIVFWFVISLKLDDKKLRKSNNKHMCFRARKIVDNCQFVTSSAIHVLVYYTMCNEF